MAETFESLYLEARRRLAAVAAAGDFEPSTREAVLLLGRAAGLTEAQVLARSRDLVPPEAATRFHRLLERRLAGEPTAYLFGEREFFGRRFRVDPRVLIPRPETEHLVEAALALELPGEPLVLDIGVGSGVIAVTLALERPGARLLGVDIAPAALAVARSNVRRHSIAERVALLASDLTAAVDLDRVDLVVSNPPYVDPEIEPRLSPEITGFEPRQALFAARRGRAILEGILAEGEALRPGTPVLLEIGYDQADWLAGSATRSPLDLLEIRKDLAGRDRVAVLRRR